MPTLAERIVQTTLALPFAELRAAFVRDVFAHAEAAELSRALDEIAGAAEVGDPSASEVLLSVVDALADPSVAEIVQRLREEAAGAPLLPLDRLLRRPAPTRMTGVERPAHPRAPRSQAGGTLGERKALARKPDRAMLERLLADPHPDVIKRLLANPRVTEEDVLRIASKRPARPSVLAELARSRWSRRPRVRLAILLNPGAPIDLTIPMAALLRRSELRLVAEHTHLPLALRSVCLEHFKRRVPLPGVDDDAPLQ